MRIVVCDAGVVTPHHTGNATNPAVNDIIIQRSVRCPEETTQEVVDRLVAETHNRVHTFRWNEKGGSPIGEIVNGLLEDLLCHI